MRFSDFVSYSRKEQEMIVRNWIDNTDFAKGMLLMGHSEERHCELDDVELLNRVIKENVPSSTFETKEDEEFNAKETLYFYTNEIIDWLTKPINEFEDRDDYRRIVLSGELISINPDEDIVCKGIDRNLNEKETSWGKIVIERNRDTLSQNGKFFCYIKTFYPDIEHETARETGRNFSKEANKMVDDGIYVDGQKFDLPVTKKAFWGFKLAGFDAFEKSDWKRGQCVAIPFEINGFRFRVEFDSNSLSCRSPFMNIETKMPDGQLKFVSLQKNKELNTDIAEVAKQYGGYLKSVFDSIATGESIETAFDKIKSPVIPYNIITKREELNPNHNSHDEQNIDI